MIPQEYIQEVVRRNDIEEVIGQYVHLRRRGRTLSGLCPFHNEKTPSFVVYPDTQSFYCFGCGAAGDVINFVRKYNNLGYVESVKQLASRVGMPLPRRKTGRHAPGSGCWRSTAAPHGISTNSSTPKRRKRPRPGVTGRKSADCPMRPSGGSAWDMRRKTSGGFCTICGAAVSGR